jgi:hypothetical protein
MKNKTFKADLEYGNSLEKKFYNKYISKLKILDGRKSDMRLLISGLGIELKSERRASTDTGNLFLERYSHKVAKTPGGPWQAKLSGSTYIVYQFADEVEKCYKIVYLVEFIEQNLNKVRVHNVNPAWSNAMGYIVPLILIEHLNIDFSTLE